MSVNYFFSLLCAYLATLPLFGYEITHRVQKLDQNTQSVALTFTLKPGEYLYKESIIASINNPHIILTPSSPSSQAVTFFDEQLKKEREGYKNSVTFTFTAKKAPEETIHQADFHMHFAVTTTTEPQEKSITLEFSKPVQEKSSANPVLEPLSPSKQILVTHTPSCEPQQPSLLGSFVQKIINWIKVQVSHAKEISTTLFTSTGSRFIRCVAALLLGLLLSLTPCIYPMIPITIGILQANGTSSGFRNFLLAGSYTLGISTTFALLGFIAALGSCVFGELQGSPWLVIPLAALLIYFGLSMFDWVHFYVPKFLQPKTSKVKGGSLLSAYLFGAISGTIASPCFSPGLILILNYVTTIGTQYTGASAIAGYLEGLLLLFIFGVGSSLPLLLIGTFSTSLHFLPKAGMWMVEIKKLVGLMLIFMAFYQLSHLERLLPWYLFVWVIVLSLFALGIYYFATVGTHDRPSMKRYKNAMGTLLIVLACIMMVQGQKALYDHFYPHKATMWLTDYDKARENALKKQKLLFY